MIDENSMSSTSELYARVNVSAMIETKEGANLARIGFSSGERVNM